MKSICLILMSLAALPALGQDNRQAPILLLSEKMFQWEVAGKLDSLEAVLDSHLLVVGSDGGYQTREQYLQRLSGGNFVHNSIEVEESKATVTDNTAVLAGKGRFTVTVSGTRSTRHLSFLEVFTRPDAHSPWKLLAIKANALAD